MKTTNYIIIGLFFILSLFLLLHHEPWRDEAQAWLIARDSPNLASLINLMSYEGTPGLWHFILFPLAKSGLPYFSMAALNFLIMLSAVIIFINYAPFPKWQKALFIFGYFIFYEYNIIARSYALSVFLLFFIALIYPQRFKKPIFYSILILFLANTNAHSLVITIPLSTLYVFEIFQNKTKIDKTHLACFFIIIAGMVMAVSQILPPQDLNLYFKNFDFSFNRYRLVHTGRALVAAFAPLPKLKINFWNSLMIDGLNYHPGRVMAMLSFILLFLLCSFFINKIKPAFLFLTSCTGLLGVFYFRHIGSIRHYGLIFIIFITCLWIAQSYEEKAIIKNKLINKFFSQKNLNRAFIFLLLVQIIAGAAAFYYECRYDFSAGKKTAAFLKKNRLIGDDIFIAGYPSYAASSISPYIPKPYSKFYCPECNEYHSFVIWNNRHLTFLSAPEIIKRIDKEISNRKYRRVLFILSDEENEEIGKDREFLQKYALLAHFGQTVVPDESFYIYERLNLPK